MRRLFLAGLVVLTTSVSPITVGSCKGMSVDVLHHEKRILTASSSCWAAFSAAKSSSPSLSDDSSSSSSASSSSSSSSSDFFFFLGLAFSTSGAGSPESAAAPFVTLDAFLSFLLAGPRSSSLTSLRDLFLVSLDALPKLTVSTGFFFAVTCH